VTSIWKADVLGAEKSLIKAAITYLFVVRNGQQAGGGAKTPLKKRSGNQPRLPNTAITMRATAAC